MGTSHSDLALIMANMMNLEQLKGWLHWHSRYYAPMFERALSRLNVVGARVLEIGCGSHGQSSLFLYLGASPVVTDLYHSLVRKTVMSCYELCGAKIPGVQARVEKLPFVDNCFDIVYSRSVLIQANVDRSAALRECQRVLRKGGVFLAMENLAYHPLAVLNRLCKQRDFRKTCLDTRDFVQIANLFERVEFYPY